MGFFENRTLYAALLTLALVSLAPSAAAQPLAPPGPSAAPSQRPAPPDGASPAPATRTPAPSAMSSPSPAASPPAASLPAAGTIPASVTLEVTGAPAADPYFLLTQIRAALDRRIRPTLRPESSVAYGPIVPWPLPPLGSGTRAAVNVNVTITPGADSTAVSGVTTVTLASVSAPAFAPSVLFLSDDPEYLESEGLVMRADVSAARPARLYYYHSDIGLPRDLDVVLTATLPSRVELISSEAGPDQDVMSVGHAVTHDFLQFKSNNEGLVADVVPGKPFVVRHALMVQGEVAAGAVDLHVLGGGPVTLSVVASPAGSPPDTYLAGPRVPFDGHNRHGAFDLTGFGDIAATYTVGGPPAAVTYGGRTPTLRNLDPQGGGFDYGDYGVIHRITLRLVNPTGAPQIVYLYEKPLAGPVSGSFYIDGRLRELGCVRVPMPYYVTTYQLPAKSVGMSTTVTMTDGGSFYPVQFGVTDAQPMPYTPPVGTPDGCSPKTPLDAQAANTARPH